MLLRAVFVALFVLASLLSAGAQVDRALEELSEKLTSDDLQTRRSAISDLSKLLESRELMLQSLTEALGDDDHFVALTSASSLGKLGPLAIPSLVQAVNAVSASKTRFALESIQRLQIEPELGASADVLVDPIVRLVDSPDPAVGQNAVEALAVMAGYNDLALAKMNDILVRLGGPSCAAMSLISAMGARARPLLPVLEQLSQHTDPEVKAIAQHAIAQIQTGQGRPNLDDITNLPALEALLTVGDFWIVESAARRIRKLGPSAAASAAALAAVIERAAAAQGNPTSSEVERTAALHARGAAIYALQDLGRAATKEAAPAIELALSDPHPWIRTIAAETVATMGEDGAFAVETLRQLQSSDPDPEVRSAAQKALQRP